MQNKQSSFKNLIELTQARAEKLSNKMLYTFVRDNLDEAGSMSFAELDQQARTLASHFQLKLQPGDRVLLLYPSGLEYIRAFFACIYANLIAVPAYAIQSPKDHSRLNAIVQDSQAKLVCTLSDQKEITESWINENGATNLSLMCTDTVTTSLEWQEPDISPNDVAFLQYTSGSTGIPKGVMVSHGNLLHNSEMIRRGFELHDESIGASWLPPYHDMGLIGGILQPLYSGIPVYLMSPMSFLKRPIRWLEVISKYRVTCTGGPNFAYDYCVKRIRESQLANLDLSCWDSATNGAEPILANTLNRFAELTKDCGFRASAFAPCYGMAETTLIVSSKKANTAPLFSHVLKTTLEAGSSLDQYLLTEQANTQLPGQLALVGSGEVLLEQCVIVDPKTHTQCHAGTVGEIWVASDSVALGYWQNAEATKEIFQAKIIGEDGCYLRTGDLGYLNGNQLIVTGRKKELIIINGRNLYPQDIEREIQLIDDRLVDGNGAVVSKTDEQSGTEQIIVIQEVQRKVTDNEELALLSNKIHSHLASEFQLNPFAIILINASSLPKTTSGKIQRRLALMQFERDELKALHDSRSNTNTTHTSSAVTVNTTTVAAPNLTDNEWLSRIRSLVASYLPEGTCLGVNQPLQTLGLDSKSAVAIAGELEEITGLELPATLVFDYPTVEALTGYIAGALSPTAPKTTASTNDVSSAPPESLSDEHLDALLHELMED